MPPSRVLLIVNTRSRSGRAIGVEARSALLALGCTVVPAEHEKRMRPAELVRLHAGAVDVVAAVGGDGTMNATAPALLETGLPLLVIPAGTGNDLARTLGIPLDPREAVRLLRDGAPRRIDIGLV